MNQNEEIERLKNYDPIADVEKYAGVRVQEDKNLMFLSLGLHMDKSKKIKKLMEETNDVHFGEKMKSYISKLLEHGFSKILEMPFVGSEKREETLYMFFDYERSILLIFDTYSLGGGEPSVNGGSFYYNWSPTTLESKRLASTSSGSFLLDEKREFACFDENFERVYVDFPERPKFGCSPYSRTEYDRVSKEINEIVNNYRVVWTGNHDCREMVFYNIYNMEMHGDFLQKWPKDTWKEISPFHYMDWKTPGLDMDEIAKERLSMLPKRVQEQIGFIAE